jgi:4-hydroxybenzoyl-CoA thioesterase/acyl-CoA thioester hydrolase
VTSEPAGDVDCPAGRGFATRRRVEFRDTDAAGIVHFSAFFFWMESAEHELLRAAGVPVIDREQVGGGDVTASWPRVSAACDYKSAVRFGDEVDVRVSVADIGRSSVTFAFRFEHERGVVAEGRIVAVRCLLRPGCKPEPVLIRPDIIARLEPYRGG